MLFDIGRVCMKISGREAGKTCVIVDKKNNFLIIDGNVKRRACNPKHLEPLDIVLKIKKGATTSEVKSAMKKEKLEVKDKKKKEKKKLEKPVKKRKTKKSGVNKKEEKSTQKKTSKKSTRKNDKKTTKPKK